MEEAAAKGKGTVTSLSLLFPVEDAQKAAKRVHEAIAEKHHQVDELRGFVADNAALINLIARLPDHLHHDIMVPFGKAAFFPGRLMHTNEFLVLLGEGYYAERTSKQTAEILIRRGKALDSQVDSLNAMVDDLKAEASFFDATASEAAEGLVEIREDYVEESSSEGESEPGPLKQDSLSSSGADITNVADEDEEFARIASRIDELEKEELEDEEFARIASRMDELEKEELEAESEIVSEEEQTKAKFEAQSDNESDEDEEIKADSRQFSDKKSLHQNLKFSEESMLRKPPQQTNDGIAANKGNFATQLSCSGLTVQSLTEDRSSHGNILASDVKSSSEKALMPSVVENAQAVPSSRSQVPLQSSKSELDSQKAFTGSIVERTHNLQTNSRKQTTATSQSAGSQSSKPVSRFKMQRK